MHSLQRQWCTFTQSLAVTEQPLTMTLQAQPVLAEAECARLFSCTVLPVVASRSGAHLLSAVDYTAMLFICAEQARLVAMKVVSVVAGAR